MNPWSIIAGAAALVMGVSLGIDSNPETDTWGLVSPSTAFSPLSVEGDIPQTATTVPARPVWTGPGCAMWADSAQDAGYVWDDLWIVLQVMELESGCLPEAIGDKGHSFGLMQINDYWCTSNQYWPRGYLQTQGMVTDCTDLLNPVTNLQVAQHISSRYGWDNWTTYRRING
jgi:hypothetical protein